MCDMQDGCCVPGEYGISCEWPGFCSDYRDGGILDAYDSEMLDERQYDALDFEERRRAETMMEDRDRREGRGRRSRLAAAMESDEGSAEHTRSV